MNDGMRNDTRIQTITNGVFILVKLRRVSSLKPSDRGQMVRSRYAGGATTICQRSRWTRIRKIRQFPKRFLVFFQSAKAVCVTFRELLLSLSQRRAYTSFLSPKDFWNPDSENSRTWWRVLEGRYDLFWLECNASGALFHTRCRWRVILLPVQERKDVIAALFDLG